MLRAHRLALLGLTALLVACGDSTPAVPDAAHDALVDLADVAPDVPPDSALDVALDVASDGPMRCAPGTTFCGAGCVDVRTDARHCGRCDMACPAGADCLAGACQQRCQATETRCEGRCVDVRTDRAHCGACGRACAAGEVCSAGACGPDCAAGVTTCERPVDGGVERVCADLTTDRAHCGACNRACMEGWACAAGRCQQVCSAAQTRCGDTCHDLTADRAHCGACGRACAGDEQCLAGRCRVPCRPGFSDCAERCVDAASDVEHCGGCGVRCRLPHVATPRCGGGRCAVGACEPGWSDCNGDPADGCEADTANDDAQCGACGAACRLPAAASRCVEGRCEVLRCAPAKADCDGMAANGCEVSVLDDDAHCGACGRACMRGQVCAMGACAAACPPGTSNCTGDCVVVARDPRHCGACGRACALPNVAEHLCAAGACAVGLCRAGFADCDGMAANGCERATASDPASCGGCGVRCAYAHASATCASGQCRMGACDPGWSDCDGDAANGCEAHTAGDASHCGACSAAGALRRCGAGEVCAAGTCGAACASGHTRCGDACADTARDARHCGGCDRACALPNVAVPVCASGQCGVGRCATGWGDCNGVAADGCEAQVRGDALHCGACGRACAFANAAAACEEGVCRMGACAEGWADCDRSPANGCEVNLRTDPLHCGACSAPNGARNCPAGQVCSAGVCRVGCDMGTVACAGLCIDVSADPRNCGACGAQCNLANATSECVARACRFVACRPGFASCDGNPANGCEVNLLGADRANCGACGRVCALPNAAGACAMGVCVPGACSAGFGDCDMRPDNGCETRLAVDGNHCGACGRRCATGQVCSNGMCVAACAMGATACGGSCRDTGADTLACGACGVGCDEAPNAYPRCLGGACGITCAAAWGNCDGVPANGCERRLDTLSDCGACARPCALPRATAACTPTGSCVVAACEDGWGNCDGNPANGCETHLATDAARCGACAGRACPSGQLCQDAACVAACATGRTRCGNGCVDTRTDPNNCGSCTAACPSRPGARAACAAGRCAIACLAGFGDCDGDPDNGCETALSSDAHCGACGQRCAAGTTCVEGRCAAPTSYRASAGTAPWIDACAAPGATRVMFARRETAVAPLSLPFAWRFWGAEIAQGAALTVSTNGYLRVGAEATAALSGVLGARAAPDGFVAAHWGDVSVRDPQVCVAVTGAAPARRLVVAWPDATYHDGAPGAHLSFEVVLEETTGVIELRYDAMTQAVPLTTGVESPDGRRVVRPPSTPGSGCSEATSRNCLPTRGTSYRFVPSF